MWRLRRWIKSQQSAIVCRHIFLIEKNLRVSGLPSCDHNTEIAIIEIGARIFTSVLAFPKIYNSKFSTVESWYTHILRKYNILWRTLFSSKKEISNLLFSSIIDMTYVFLKRNTLTISYKIILSLWSDFSCLGNNLLQIEQQIVASLIDQLLKRKKE